MENDILHEEFDMPVREFAVKEAIYHQDSHHYCFFPHWHRYLEFLFILDGGLNLKCNGSNIDAKKNDIVVFNCNEVHTGCANELGVEYYCLIVDMKMLESKAFDECEKKFILPILQGRIKFENLISSNEMVMELMNGIIEEFKEKKYGYELKIKSLLYDMITILLREHITNNKKNNALIKNAGVISDSIQFVNDHYSENLQLSDLSDNARFSEAYFCRMFKNVIGMTPIEYLNYTRIMKANELLLAGNINVTEASLAVGITNPNYFSRLYKKWLFKSPRTVKRYYSE
ncbi:MAG: AraC family transcriptional regulator [Saccharofermentanales bacterium]